MNPVVNFGGNVDFEYLILGAGPAGLQMGHHLSRAGHSYLILEAGDCPGHFFKTSPRHRTLIFDRSSLLSEGDGRLLFEDYSRKGFPSADEMVRYLGDYADFHELNVRCNARILRVEKPRPSQFRLHDAAGVLYTCRRLIVATGVNKPNILAIPDIEPAESDVEVPVDPCAGFRFDDSIFAADCRPELVSDGRFPAQTPEWESVNIPGLYFAGALMRANDDEKHTCGFIHGFRYNVRCLFRMLEKKHHHRQWPAREIEPTPEGLVEAALERINRTSALWQQTGFLHDVIMVDEGWDRAVYYEEMPLAYVHASAIGDSRHYYTVTLELGKVEGGPLHPAIRRWCGRHLVSEQRLLEDLSGEWKKPDSHVAPLRFFFMEQLLETAEMGGPEMEEMMEEAVLQRELHRVAV
ncbi:MAG: hypothetical protein QOF89_906 [Acidobacteriota bacterium]|jgi:thioredoxin reductase|nr:hypothetical protein [Acidobacteriota bacterium]